MSFQVIFILKKNKEKNVIKTKNPTSPFRVFCPQSSPCLGPTSPSGQSRRSQPGLPWPAMGEDAQGEALASSACRPGPHTCLPEALARCPPPGPGSRERSSQGSLALTRWRGQGWGSGAPLCLFKAGGGLDLAWDPDWQVPGFRRGSQHSWVSRPASLLLAEPCPSCLRVFARNCRATPSRCGVSTGRARSDFSKSALRHPASAGPRTAAPGPGDRCGQAAVGRGLGATLTSASRGAPLRELCLLCLQPHCDAWASQLGN